MKNMKLIPLFAALLIAVAPAATLADGVSVKLNGNELEFDVPPQIINDRTMVPLRVIFESLGAAVEWDGSTQTVTSVKGDISIKMTIGENAIYINNESKELDASPVIIEGRTLVPVRAVAEGFGAVVAWDGDTQTVIISSDDKKPADGEKPANGEPPAKPDSEIAPTKPEGGNEPPAKPSDVPVMPSGDTSVIDTSSDLMSESINNFRIDSLTKTDNGKYKIEFSFFTFLEGAGSVSATFNCLDENGNVVDTFSGVYKTIDYTQTPQKGEAEISGKTVKIVLGK